ncbi:MAG TPA: hypothetical protein VL486_05775 [Verrucomicrobiae bacterium]|nr:hypothetical protein [Verrucomicrobiae bacterium]
MMISPTVSVTLFYQTFGYERSCEAQQLRETIVALVHNWDNTT